VTAVDTDAETVTVRPRDGEPFDQPYDDLLAADGLYAHLWQIQAGLLDDLPPEFIERAVARTARVNPS
jgi:hypothetical protein